MFSTAFKLLILLIFSWAAAYSQIAQSERFEIEIESRYDTYHIVTAGDQGLLL